MSERSLGNGVPFEKAVQLARQLDDAKLERQLGLAQLIGAPPAPLEEGDEEWSYQTRLDTYTEASARVGIDLGAAFVFPVRKARLSFFAGTILVGRASSSDVCIDHPSISKLHARMRRSDAGVWTIEDADSTNGVTIAGRRIAGEEPLAYGTRVCFGRFVARFERLPETAALLRG